MKEQLWRIPKPLTAEAFALYGDVVEMSDAVEHFPINYGYTERYHDLAGIDVQAQEGRPGASLFRSQPLPLPVTIEILERHPLSSQLFMPLSPQPYLVVVAPAGELKEETIEVFLAQPGQGVNYRAGTWHHYCLALNAASDFLVIDRLGGGDNCDEVTLKSPFHIDLTGNIDLTGISS